MGAWMYTLPRINTDADAFSFPYISTEGTHEGHQRSCRYLCFRSDPQREYSYNMLFLTKSCLNSASLQLGRLLLIQLRLGSPRCQRISQFPDGHHLHLLHRRPLSQGIRLQARSPHRHQKLRLLRFTSHQRAPAPQASRLNIPLLALALLASRLGIHLRAPALLASQLNTLLQALARQASRLGIHPRALAVAPRVKRSNTHRRQAQVLRAKHLGILLYPVRPRQSKRPATLLRLARPAQRQRRLQSHPAIRPAQLRRLVLILIPPPRAPVKLPQRLL